MKINAIITAGGTSSRYGKSNKLLEDINGKKVIQYTVEAFLACSEISQVIICANKSIIGVLNEIFKNLDKVKIIEGGENRQKSVYNGLCAAVGCDYVLIHDGARPMIKSNVIKGVIDEV